MFDCLIIGGGAVGASLACALRGTGWRIGLIEAVPIRAEAQPSYDDRGLALSYSSQRILDGIGVWPALAAQAVPIRHIHVSEQGCLGAARLSAEDCGWPALAHVLVARALGKALYRQLETSGHCELICPARLQSITAHPDKLDLLLQQNGQDRVLSARLVIAADGTASRARTCLGITTQGRDYGQSAIVVNVTPARPHPFTAYERFTPQGPIALLPQAKGCYGLVFVRHTMEASRLLELPEAGFLEELVKQFSRRLGDFKQLGRRQVYPLRLLTVARVAGPRHIVIGNAANTVHPNGAQGLNLGLRDVAVLAELLHAAARDHQDPGEAKITAAYAEQRRADHRRTVRFTDGLARLFYNNSPPLAVMRRLAMWGADNLPAAKNELIRAASGLQGNAPALVRGLPL
jgi:2-octaprenyl-6-methoxyphenol hydroxylase